MGTRLTGLFAMLTSHLIGNGSRLVVAGLCVVAGLAMAVPARAQERLNGEYRCVRIETAGHTEACQSPPLTLNRDGSYKIWGEEGTYEVVQGKWLVLSHSKRRGLGHVQSAGEIVFEY